MEKDGEFRGHLRVILQDADCVWEAIGPDGIRYDFNTNMLRMDEQARGVAREAMALIDGIKAESIAICLCAGGLLDAELGKLLREQAENYYSDDIERAIGVED